MTKGTHLLHGEHCLQEPQCKEREADEGHSVVHQHCRGLLQAAAGLMVTHHVPEGAQHHQQPISLCTQDEKHEHWRGDSCAYPVPQEQGPASMSGMADKPATSRHRSHLHFCLMPSLGCSGASLNQGPHSIPRPKPRYPACTGGCNLEKSSHPANSTPVHVIGNIYDLTARHVCALIIIH